MTDLRKPDHKPGYVSIALAIAGVTVALAISGCGDSDAAGSEPANSVQIGRDNNFSGNNFIQPADPALAGGGIDQTLQFGDVLYGTLGDDVEIGQLGVDVLFGGDGDDVLIGGLEHFNPLADDRIFAGAGNDIVVWAPGDGSDLMDGGSGEDVLILGVVGEVEGGRTVFRVSDDQQAGEVYLAPDTNLPVLEVSSSPGFCPVIDRSSSPGAAAELSALGIQHLVQFFVRDKADSFASGAQHEDNGLRQTMHLKDMEALICTSREGGRIEVLDLTVSPPRTKPLSALALSERLQTMVR